MRNACAMARRRPVLSDYGLAPRPGFEPGTHRLTADCSTVELSRNDRPRAHASRSFLRHADTLVKPDQEANVAMLQLPPRHSQPSRGGKRLLKTVQARRPGHPWRRSPHRSAFTGLLVRHGYDAGQQRLVAVLDGVFSRLTAAARRPL